MDGIRSKPWLPGTPQAPTHQSLAMVPAGILLLTISGLLFLTQLQVPLLEPQEPRYAEVSRQMLATNSWVVPVLDGQPYLDKPPLFYWLIMFSYQVCGVHDWAARLVPGLAGVLTVLLTWLWGRALVGARAAFWSALILCLSARFVYLQRLLTFDSVLCLTVTAGLAAAHLALRETRLRWPWWLASAAACGLGVLAKGPVAVALVLPPVLAYRYLDARCPRPSLAAVAAYLATAGLVAGPWFAAIMVLQQGFAGYFFWTHNVVRFVAPFDHEEPFWFHLPGLLLGLLPWSLLLPGLVGSIFRRWPWTAARRPAAMVFFLLASGWIVLFFSVAGCKRAVYILPAIPPLALALGSYLSTAMQNKGSERFAVVLLPSPPVLRGRGVGGEGAAPSPTLGAWRFPPHPQPLSPGVPGERGERHSSDPLFWSAVLSVVFRSAKERPFAERKATLVAPNRLAGLASRLLLLLSLVAVVVAAKNRLVSLPIAILAGGLLTALLPLLWFNRFRTWPWCAGLTFALLLGALHGILPAYSRQFALREQLLPYRQHEKLMVLCYPQCWESVSFYLPGARIKVFPAEQEALLLREFQAHPDAVLVVRSGRWQRDVVEHLPPGLEFVVEQGQGSVVVGRVRLREEVTRGW